MKRMKKSGNKRWIAWTVTAAMAATIFTGCGNGGADNSSNSGKADNAAENTADNTEVRKLKLGFYASSPFISINEDGELEGYEYELIQAAIDNLPQYDIEYEATEWDSVLTGLDAGTYDLAVGCIFHSREREEKYYFSEPLLANRMGLIVQEDRDDLNCLDDLVGKKSVILSVGSAQDQAYQKYFEEYPDKTFDLEYAELDKVSSRTAVAEGKYDFILVDYVGQKQFAKKYDIPVKFVDLPQEDIDILGINSNTYALISKSDENKQLAEDLNAELKKLYADGTAKEISEKYFDEDLSPKE